MPSAGLPISTIGTYHDKLSGAYKFRRGNATIAMRGR